MPKIITLSQIQNVARLKNGKCLSKKYLGAHTKLKWECHKGHVWKAIPDSVKRGSWCPYCSPELIGLKRRKYDLSDMQKVAKKKNGKCLSKTYKGTYNKLTWQCKEGHTWDALPSSILQGTWCKACGEKRSALKRSSTIEQMHQLAAKKGGKCLSKKYINSNQKLSWVCKNGHKWQAVGNSISQGRWCPICSIVERGMKQRCDISEMHAVAALKGGKCISTEYTNSTTKLLWECADGHQWHAQPSNIKSGFWCPECNNLVGEKIVRTFFEKIFNKKFPKKKPLWLKGYKGSRLELDGYCEEIGLAFEHQGRHHYANSVYTLDKNTLLKVRNNDRRKAELCKKNKVILIQIPEVGFLTKFEDLAEFIYKNLRKAKIIPKNISTTDIKIEEIIKNSSQLTALKAIAALKNGNLISTAYLGNHKKLRWQCHKGHIWETTPARIKQGRWCHECNPKKKFTIEQMQEIAKSRKGFCLSKEYINRKHKLSWKCHAGHVWKAGSVEVKAGSWCPTCAHTRSGNSQRGTIAEMNLIAKQRGGKCLSKEYKNAHTKLKWKCKEGHIWATSPSVIKSGGWCMQCHLNRRKCI